jgi:hypothetical protein
MIGVIDIPDVEMDRVLKGLVSGTDHHDRAVDRDSSMHYRFVRPLQSRQLLPVERVDEKGNQRAGVAHEQVGRDCGVLGRDMAVGHRVTCPQSFSRPRLESDRESSKILERHRRPMQQAPFLPKACARP